MGHRAYDQLCMTFVNNRIVGARNSFQDVSCFKIKTGCGILYYPIFTVLNEKNVD